MSGTPASAFSLVFFYLPFISFVFLVQMPNFRGLNVDGFSEASLIGRFLQWRECVNGIHNKRQQQQSAIRLMI